MDYYALFKAFMLSNNCDGATGGGGAIALCPTCINKGKRGKCKKREKERRGVKRREEKRRGKNKEMREEGREEKKKSVFCLQRAISQMISATITLFLRNCT